MTKLLKFDKRKVSKPTKAKKMDGKGIAGSRKPIKKIGRWAKKDKESGIFKRTIGNCERCLTRRELDNQHIIGRVNKHLRYKEDNLIKLCRECHNWQRENPEAFLNWFKIVYANRWKFIEEEKNIYEV